MNFEGIVLEYIKEGYGELAANSKVGQEIILLLMGNSKYSRNITIKGGVVMHNISMNMRRATRDLDLDFIKYSLEDVAIKDFVLELNKNKYNIKIKIIGEIKRLHQQDYDGKRVNIILTDKFGFNIKTKLDIGVHKNFNLEQDEYCFDLGLLNDSVTLFINSPEQIFIEKLKSLLKFGLRSTRYKDIFDFYYLINCYKLDKNKLTKYFSSIIFDDEQMRENNVLDVKKRLTSIFNSYDFKKQLANPAVNWLDIDVDVAILSIMNFLDSLKVCS